MELRNRKSEVAGQSGAVAAGDALLDEAVRRLVEALQPERIYLFGSRARGDFDADSDYDFMVVVPDGTEAGSMELQRTAYRALSGIDVPRDVLVWTSTQFAYYLPVVASLAATVAREGRLLHGPPLPAMETLSPMELEKRKAELTGHWLSKVKQGLEVADRGAQPPAIPSAVVFHSQQAAEKALKAFLSWHHRPFEKTHELDKLVEQCADIANDFASLLDAARRLSPYALAGRYPASEVADRYPHEAVEPDSDQADEALKLARKIVAFVEGRLPPKAPS